MHLTQKVSKLTYVGTHTKETKKKEKDAIKVVLSFVAFSQDFPFFSHIFLSPFCTKIYVLRHVVILIIIISVLFNILNTQEAFEYVIYSYSQKDLNIVLAWIF